jgi:hypothetical protein
MHALHVRKLTGRRGARLAEREPEGEGRGMYAGTTARACAPLCAIEIQLLQEMEKQRKAVQADWFQAVRQPSVQRRTGRAPAGFRLCLNLSLSEVQVNPRPYRSESPPSRA